MANLGYLVGTVPDAAPPVEPDDGGLSARPHPFRGDAARFLVDTNTARYAWLMTGLAMLGLVGYLWSFARQSGDQTSAEYTGARGLVGRHAGRRTLDVRE